MKKEDVVALLYVELIGSQLDGERLAHLPLDKQLNAIARMALYAYDCIADTVVHTRNGESIDTDVMRDWRLDQ